MTPTPDPPCNGVQSPCNGAMADPPSAAPLTAEEIAVMQGFATTWQKMGGRAVNAQLAGQCLGDTLASHAALRGRLARREAALVDSHAEINGWKERCDYFCERICLFEEAVASVDRDIEDSDRDASHEKRATTREWIRGWAQGARDFKATLTACLAPTDGAARAGDAAEDEGGAT